MAAKADDQPKNAQAESAAFDSDWRPSALVWSLLEVSEKAATIARECRARKKLFELLVQEKTGDEKNPRVLHDFKTLADVLVQETVKHHLCTKWPTLGPHILGEENNSFTNAKGQCIVVEVKSNKSETLDLLEKVLDGNQAAATSLADAVHQEPDVAQAVRDDFERLREALDERGRLPSLDDIGIWIDPIDGTFEYVEGRWDSESSSADEPGPHRFGLRCCTVLIGGFLRSTGAPIFSVVSQPFATPHGGPTTSFFCVRTVHNICELPVKFNIVVSSVERPDIREKLEQGFSVTEASAAGYKLLIVALGWCEAYVCSRGNTYRWDTCAPHALLESQGGGIRRFDSNDPIHYNVSGKGDACNDGGFIAYRREDVCRKILALLDIS